MGLVSRQPEQHSNHHLLRGIPVKLKTEAYKIDIEAATFYIKVVSAEHGTRYNFDKHRDVEEIIPRVWISTDPEFKGDVEKGHAKIRGRKYSTEYTYKRLPDDRGEVDLHGVVMKWTTDSRTWNGGRRNDKGQQLDYETKAHGTLSGWEVDALNAFEAEYPGWKTESIRRLFEYERNRHDEKAKALLREVAQEQIEAAKWEARLSELGS
ncbi:hypothetical protein NX794_07740 [Streptomyces sp. LP11]|uniref:Uncharacterized protein n=1 Tax=Streptomyces pyxinicus TaxID=2970331 RepID=A0ABT2AY05_9ACTN|nr:hypothetical protein [Streptomyces sp. LP11]MCS0601122.1 hypothetical protein [Streptomyces sp. LP11]